jgi:hypothetical protein
MMLVFVSVVTGFLMAIVGGREELIASTRQPKLYSHLGIHAFGIGTSNWGALFHQVVHRAVTDPATKHEIDPEYCTCQSAAATARLDDTLP